jgi:hypothetical protein
MRGHSEGQDPPEAGRLTSDDAGIVSPPDQQSLRDVQEVTSRGLRPLVRWPDLRW